MPPRPRGSRRSPASVPRASGGRGEDQARRGVARRARGVRARDGALGRAGVSRKHALALVNRGGATAAELLAAARAIRDGVRAGSASTLEPEPVHVGCDRGRVKGSTALCSGEDGPGDGDRAHERSAPRVRAAPRADERDERREPAGVRARPAAPEEAGVRAPDERRRVRVGVEEELDRRARSRTPPTATHAPPRRRRSRR